MSRSRFTRRQWLVLVLMTVALVLVFGLFGYSVVTTMQYFALTSPLPTSSAVSLRLTPLATSLLPTPAPPTATPSPTPTAPPPPTPTATRPVPLSQIQSARAVPEIGRIVAGVRHLSPVEQIPVTFPTEHEVAIYLLQTYQDEAVQETLARYITLGLIPPLDPLPLPDVAEQAAHISSLYLPAGQQIMLVAGRGPATPADEQALVFALAHALQDQAFDIEGLTPCRPTTDAELALRALVEGDGVVTTARYAEMDAEGMDELAQNVAAALEPTYTPLVGNAAAERLRLFPYREGAQFVTALYDAGSWRAVDRAYGQLPCSTEQILHPELYLAGEPVQEVVLPDLGPVLGWEWEPTWQDTLGELVIGLHLAAYVDDEAVAWDAAAGWAGDSFALWEDVEGQQLLAWRIAWDDRDEAEEFERAYELLVPRFRVPPLIAAEPPPGLTGSFWEGPAGAAYLSRTGRIVTVVWGPDGETVAAVAQALP